ncbi:MAG: serine/threonine-protein kinase [Lysobacterales bacterium]
MPSDAPEQAAAAASDAFARLRLKFHELLEQAPSERELALVELRKTDAALAEELRELLESVPPEASTESVCGSSFGPFTAAEELGRGGMAVVYRGYRHEGGFAQTVALKLLHPGTRSSASQQRFLRERQVLARLEHPGIARLIDAGITADGRLWLAMEYIAGADLHTVCSNRALPLAHRVQLLTEVCDAVAYAHSRLVLHRDLKPANIRVGEDGRPRLLDFGIARLLDDTDPQLTATGFQALTPRYAAPEQFRGDSVTTACDVYALGVILRELCVDGSPLKDHVLRAVADRASATQPTERYRSASALADDLRDWLAGRNLRSGIGSRRARSWRWMRQYRWPLSLGCTILVALAVGGLATWHQADRAAHEAQRTRAHLNALLEVLGAASPQVYAGHDPPASAFLVEAAERLQQQGDADPELLWLSLNQIGNGLINLGRPNEGRDILQAALSALEKDTSMAVSLRRQRQLDNLRLLVQTLESDTDPKLLQRFSSSIMAVSAKSEVPPAPTLGALAAAAGVAARLNEFELAQRMLDLASRLEPRAELEPEQAESYWRQRGWVALRGRQLDQAQAALDRAMATIDAFPEKFSTMRRAEAQWLLAALALQNDDADSAAHWLELAAPSYAAEYPPNHPELAVFHLMQGYQALLDRKPQAALRWLQPAQIVLSGETAASDDLQAAHFFHAAALAQTGRCPDARAQAEMAERSASPLLPNRRHLIERARNWWQVACGAEKARPEL